MLKNLMNTEHTIETLVENILQGRYPLDSEGDINYELFYNWDEKYENVENVMFFLKQMAKSDNYMVLFLLSTKIKNVALSFIDDNASDFCCIIKKAMSHNCSRANIYFFQEIIRLIKNEHDVQFYLKMLNLSESIVQNQGVSLLQYLSIDTIKIFSNLANNNSFSSFFNGDNRDIKLLDTISVSENGLFQKIYVTGLYKCGFDKFQLIKHIDGKNYDLVDYVYLFLD